MKKKIFLFPLIVFLFITLFSCQEVPDAGFYSSKTDAATYDAIKFINTSSNGYIWVWDFGDGHTSDQRDPTHTYKNDGSYNVELTAYSKNKRKSDIASQRIKVTHVNEVRFDGIKYPLSKGAVEFYGDWIGAESNYNFDVYLADNGINFNINNITGSGNLIYLELWTDSTSNLVPGIYTFDDTHAPFTVSSAFFGKNLNFDEGTGQILNLTDGSVSFLFNGSDYVFQASFPTLIGVPLSFYYKGHLTFFDRTDKKTINKGKNYYFSKFLKD